MAFKTGKYQSAVDLYTKAIGKRRKTYNTKGLLLKVSILTELKPLEPSYLTNRAASYMALKRFRPALEDCQMAATIQASSPSSKTLLRLARCQLALGSTTPALSTIRTILALEPANTQAMQLRGKVQALEHHVHNFESARKKKEWGLARLCLDKCLHAIEGEGGDIPDEWRIWRVELELCRGNWESANNAAKYVFFFPSLLISTHGLYLIPSDALRLKPNSPDALSLRGLVLFLCGRLPQALQHVTSALRLDPGHEPAQRLRKRVKDVEKLKEEGNVAFKTGKFQEAISKYAECLAVRLFPFCHTSK